MRSWVGRLLMLLGAFLLVAAAVSTFWGRNAAERTPVNTDQWTYLSGAAQRFDGTTGKVVPVPVVYNEHTIVDPARSNGSVITFITTTCLMADTGNPPPCVDGKDTRLIQAQVQKVVLDRKTGLPVPDQAKYVGTDNVLGVSGLYNKWPFNAQQKTYPYWDSQTGKAVEATFAGVKSVRGLRTYQYDITIPTTKTEVATDTPGTYANQTQIWVEPTTGAIVDEHVAEQLKFSDGSTALSVHLAETPATVKANVDTAHQNVNQLKLVGLYIPIVGFVLGLALLAAGFLLLRRRGRTPAEPTGEEPVAG